MTPVSVSQTLRKMLACMAPATPPPPPPRRRFRVGLGRRGRLPGARWRLPLVQLVACAALLVLLGGCEARPSAIAGPVVLAVSIFGLCLRPARAPRPVPLAAEAACRAVQVGNLTTQYVALLDRTGLLPLIAGVRRADPDIQRRPAGGLS